MNCIFRRGDAHARDASDKGYSTTLFKFRDRQNQEAQGAIFIYLFRWGIWRVIVYHQDYFQMVLPLVRGDIVYDLQNIYKIILRINRDNY